VAAAAGAELARGGTPTELGRPHVRSGVPAGCGGGVELARGSASTAFQPRPSTQGSPAWRERGLGELCTGPSRELRGGALPRPRARELCTRRHGRDAGEICVSHLRRARTTSTPTAASGSVRRLAQFDTCAAIWINGRCDAQLLVEAILIHMNCRLLGAIKQPNHREKKTNKAAL
jgi:hypothetical protein